MEFREMNADRLRLCAAAVIERAGQFFLIRRAQKPFVGSWSPVAGGVEPGESIAEAAVREAREELGLTVEAVEEFFACTSADGTAELHFVLARWVDGEPAPDPREVLEWCSVTFEEMCILDEFETDRAAFAKLHQAR
jgi:8-oxo-dGTP diphosphatase